MIRVKLPHHLRTLSGVQGEIEIQVDGVVTQNTLLDALETTYPMLRGTIRDYKTGQRRSLVRFFADGEDWSHESADTKLPKAIIEGKEPFLIVGAMAGGS